MNNFPKCPNPKRGLGHFVFVESCNRIIIQQFENSSTDSG
jgi:hypothetical protein